MKILTYLKKDEKAAPRSYSKLLKKVTTKRDKRIVRGIIKDERRHLKLLKTIR